MIHPLRTNSIKTVGRKLQWVVEKMSSITGGIAALSIVAAALVVTEGIITRKVLGLSAIWQIEASVFLLIFATFVGAPFVQKNEHHLNVDLVLIYLSPKTREIVLIIVSILTSILAGLLAWFGWPMWWEAVIRNDHSYSLWSPPLWIPYFFLPFGMSLLLFQYIVQIIKRIVVLKKGMVREEVTRVKLKEIEVSEGDSSPNKE
jgi:TRAP-type C4-dicarboxylate transport system permease small subunit